METFLKIMTIAKERSNRRGHYTKQQLYGTVNFMFHQLQNALDAQQKIIEKIVEEAHEEYLKNNSLPAMKKDNDKPHEGGQPIHKCKFCGKHFENKVDAVLHQVDCDKNKNK